METDILSVRTSKRYDFYLTLLTTLVAFGLNYLAFGMYYVEYEGMVSSFISGKLTPGIAFRSLHFIGHIGTSYIYSKLYEIAPNVEWISFIFCGYLLVSTFIGLYLVARLLPGKTSLIAKATIQLLIFFLIFSDHFTNFIYTRTAYMLCGVSLLSLIFFYGSGIPTKRRLPLFIFFNLLFTIGAFTRVESATACVLLIMLFAVFYLQSIKTFFLLLTYPLILVISISAGVAVDIQRSSEYYKQVEPDIEAQYTTRKNLEPLSAMKTHKDTVLYMAASNFLWSDAKVFSPAFLRSMIIPEKYMFTDLRQWKRVYEDIAEITARYWYLVIINILFGLVLLFSPNQQTRLYYRSRWFIFEMSFWILTAVQTYTVKVNDRSFVPLLSIFLLCHILLIIQNKPVLKTRSYIILSLVFVLFIRHVYYLKAESSLLKQNLLSYQSAFDRIKDVAKGKYLVLNSASCDYLFLSNTPFHPFDFSAFKKVYISDGYIMPFLYYYKLYLERECNCDMYKYPSFLIYLKSISQQVVFVSDAASIDIISDYLQYQYYWKLPIWKQDSMSLSPLAKTDTRDNAVALKVYRFVSP